MKTENFRIKLGIFRYLLFSPLLLLTFCESEEEVYMFETEARLTKESKVISLMRTAIGDSSKQISTKSGTIDDQCTEFVYPMTFNLFLGDGEPTPAEIIINSDEDLLEFYDSLTTSSWLYINFPIKLTDSDGIETEINDLTELEGTLQMLVDACVGDDDSDDNNDDDSDDDNYEFCHSNNKKVNICHKGKTICVSINAIWGHLSNHDEDYLGSCK